MNFIITFFIFLGIILGIPCILFLVGYFLIKYTKTLFERVLKNVVNYLRQIFHKKTRQVILGSFASSVIIGLILVYLWEEGHLVIYITSFPLLDGLIFLTVTIWIPITLVILIYRIFAVWKFQKTYKKIHKLKFADEIKKLELLEKLN